MTNSICSMFVLNSDVMTFLMQLQRLDHAQDYSKFEDLRLVF